MDLFGSAISLENDTRHNKRVGTSICNVEGFDFLGFKTESIVLELIFIISWLLWNNRNARWAGENVMSHSTLIQRGMDLYQQVQAVKEWRFLEHLCSSV